MPAGDAGNRNGVVSRRMESAHGAHSATRNCRRRHQFSLDSKDPRPRARLYIEDGQGAIKLQIAHQKRALEAATDPDDAEELRQMIEVWSDWLAGQRIEALVEVNLGSWSGLNTRKMAEEAGFIDFYNYVYQPFSSVVHSNWAHVSMFNTVHCQNPAHRWHRGAAIAAAPVDINWLYLATKYLSKTFGHFDDVYGLSASYGVQPCCGPTVRDGERRRKLRSSLRFTASVSPF